MALSATKQRSQRWANLVLMTGTEGIPFGNRVNAFFGELIHHLYASFASANPSNATEKQERIGLIEEFLKSVAPDDLVCPLGIVLSNHAELTISQLPPSKRNEHVYMKSLVLLAERAFADTPEKREQAMSLLANPTVAWPKGMKGFEDLLGYPHTYPNPAISS